MDGGYSFEVERNGEGQPVTAIRDKFGNVFHPARFVDDFLDSEAGQPLRGTPKGAGKYSYMLSSRSR